MVGSSGSVLSIPIDTLSLQEFLFFSIFLLVLLITIVRIFKR